MEYVENGTTQSGFQQLYIETKNGSVAIAVHYNYTHIIVVFGEGQKTTTNHQSNLKRNIV